MVRQKITPSPRAVLKQIDVGARVAVQSRKHLKSAPFGWSQDAVDAALIALHRSGHLRATRNGQPVAVGALDQPGVKAAEFRPEKIRLTTTAAHRVTWFV